MLPTFAVPPIGPSQGKIWGFTQLIFAYNGVECHKITFRAGAYCSKHIHHIKWNRFVVISGILKIRIFHDEDIAPNEMKIDETTIQTGQVSDVPPGVLHQFEGVEDGEAIELYWAVLDAQDIERIEPGGIIKL